MSVSASILIAGYLTAIFLLGANRAPRRDESRVSDRWPQHDHAAHRGVHILRDRRRLPAAGSPRIARDAMAIAIYGPGLVDLGWYVSTLLVTAVPTIIVSLYRDLARRVALVSIAGGCVSTIPFALAGVLDPDLGPIVASVGAVSFLVIGLSVADDASGME
jgi:hypothetical protein